MYDTDARHPSETLERKLRALYGLRRGGRLEMGFRAPYVRLLESFGNPHLSLPPAIHVAGTNGKGSTVAFLRAILEAGGYRVHAYTSPHLVRFNERIRLNGVEIADSDLEALIDEAMERNAGGEVTFFEITTALAFAAFLGLYALGRRLYGPGALGMGDVKLAALVAAVVGLPAAGTALLLGVLLAGGAAAVWLLSGRAGRGALLPYGTFLALGGLVVLVIVS
mgnify:CR=1 FL=1